MPAPLVVIALAMAGLAAGGAVRLWLRRGSWRRPGEEHRRLPRLPWEPVAVAVLWPALWVHLERTGHLPAWPALAWVALAGVLLTSIDLAVHRLPDVFTLGSIPPVAALLVLASVVQGAGGGLVSALWAAGAAAAVLLILGLAGLGMGDVKLGLLLALTLGWFGIVPAAWGLMYGFVLGGLWAGALLVSGRARVNTTFAYGPWMLLGAAVALFTQVSAA